MQHHSTALALVLAIGACGTSDEVDKMDIEGMDMGDQDTGDKDDADVDNRLMANIDGMSSFKAQRVGVNVFASNLTLMALDGDRSFSISFPKAAGTYSCATPQSGVTDVLLRYGNTTIGLRADATYARPKSSCTIEVMTFGAVIEGTFVGTLISTDDQSYPITDGAFSVKLPK